MKRYQVSLVLLIVMVSLLSFTQTWGADEKPVVAPVVGNPAAEFKSWGGMLRPGIVSGPGDQIHDKDKMERQTDFHLEFFYPIWQDKSSLIFIDPRMRLADNESHEFNFGLGYRTLFNNDSMIFGANTYFDYLRSTNDFHYGQFGLGFELLSKWVDARANYYYPFNRRINLVSIDTISDPLYDLYKYEEALRGADAEIGVLVPYISEIMETRIFAGGFWYSSWLYDHINGFKGRIEIRPMQVLSLNYEMRKDSTRKTDNFFGAYLDIPFSFEALAKTGNPFEGFKEGTKLGAYNKGARTVKERMTDRVIRDRHITIVTGVVKKAKSEAFCVYGETNYSIGEKVYPSCSEGYGTETWTCTQGYEGGIWEKDTSACSQCQTNADCTDGLYCNGTETCVSGTCQPGTAPCSGETPNCNEQNDTCYQCQTDADCTDGLYCNGTETCVSGTCQPGTDPCTGNDTCNETTNQCELCGGCILDPDNNNKGCVWQVDKVISTNCNAIAEPHICATQDQIDSDIDNPHGACR